MEALFNAIIEESGCLGKIFVVHFDANFYALLWRTTTEFICFAREI